MKAILTIVGVLGLLIAGLVWSLLPPELDIPEVQAFRLSDATIIQPNEFTLEHQDVLVVDGKIAGIGPTGTLGTEVPAISQGGFVMPGLIDLHVHYPPRLAVGQQSLWSLLFLLLE